MKPVLVIHQAISPDQHTILYKIHPTRSFSNTFDRDDINNGHSIYTTQTNFSSHHRLGTEASCELQACAEGPPRHTPRLASGPRRSPPEMRWLVSHLGELPAQGRQEEIHLSHVSRVSGQVSDHGNSGVHEEIFQGQPHWQMNTSGRPLLTVR